MVRGLQFSGACDEAAWMAGVPGKGGHSPHGSHEIKGGGGLEPSVTYRDTTALPEFPEVGPTSYS